LATSVHCVCYDTLPWLIYFSLGENPYLHQLSEMMTPYFKKRDNPWELLVIAFWFFAPGLALALYRGPALFLRHRTRASFTPGGVHLAGWWAIAVGAALAVLYFYARRTNTSEPSSRPLVTVANCYNLGEAYRLQMALGAEDIPSFIPDEATAQNVPYIFLGSSAGVRLQVAEEDISAAQRIIVDNAFHTPETLGVPEVGEDDKNVHDDDAEKERF
jgi:hypothetical protein